MSILDNLKTGISALTPMDFACFVAWFEINQANRFDEAIADDVTNGHLDSFAEQALKDLREGRISLRTQYE